ncbi:hypothetical protein Nmel_017816 [Mimus melanotis]
MCGCMDVYLCGLWMCGCVDAAEDNPVLGRAAAVGWHSGVSAHPGCLAGTQQLSAKESGSVSVQCHYKVADYRTVTKAWCKMEGETCKVLVTSSPEPPAGNSTAREGVRMQDDSQQGIVTVTMEQLQPQDSGVYWCALQERSALSRMEEVTLRVSRGNREAEDTRDRAEGTAQPGSTGRRGSSQDGSKESGYINLDVQAQPSPEDPLYCNVEPSQDPRNPPCVEYAVIAFNQSPRSARE